MTWPPRDLPAPYLLTLMFLTEDEAHEVIEMIKHRSGVAIVGPGPDMTDPTRIDLTEPKIVHCSIADFRKWGDRPKVYRSTLPGGKYQDGIAPDGHPKYRERPEV